MQFQSLSTISKVAFRLSLIPYIQLIFFAMNMLRCKHYRLFPLPLALTAALPFIAFPFRKTVEPPRWWDPLWNKCNNPNCRYRNVPQPVKGTFNCQGGISRNVCRGTYKVTSAQARKADLYYKAEFKQLAEEKLEEERRAAELKRRARRPAFFHENATHGGLRKTVKLGVLAVDKDLPPLPIPPGLSVRDPEADRRRHALQEKQYIRDKLLQEWYPEYKWCQRW
jgi:hypothetical protein